MPKRFGHTALALLVAIAAISFSGCRSATTKLAGVPGMGWLDRSEEGWAGYEPAPGLPTPSSTSEPTTSGSSAANIASNTATPPNSLLGSSSRSMPMGDLPSVSGSSKNRFDPKYVAKDLKKSTQSTYGDYASAYGKYGPPKAGTEKSPAYSPQQGKYGGGEITPKYAATDSKGFDVKGSPTFGTKATAGNSKLSPYASKPSAPANTKIPAKYDPFSADKASPSIASATSTAPARASRFGTGPSTSPSYDASSYKPPNFSETSSPASTLAQSGVRGSRFGDVAAATQSTAQAVQGGANTVAQNLQNATNGLASQTDNSYNKLSTAAQNSVGGYVATAKEQVANATQTATANANGTYNRFANAAQNTAGGYVDAAKQSAANAQGQLANTANQYTASLQKATSPYVDAAKQQAAAVQNQLSNTGYGAGLQNAAAPYVGAAKQKAAEVQSQLTNTASQYAAGAQNTASQYLDAAKQKAAGVQSQLSNTASQYATGAQNAAAPYVAAAKQQAEGIQNKLNGMAASPYGQPASPYGQAPAANPLQNATNAAATQLQTAKQYADNTSNQFFNKTQSSVNNVANQSMNAMGGVVQQAQQTATGMVQQTQNSANSYANSLLKSTQAAASSTVNNAVGAVTDSPTYRTASNTVQGYRDAAAGAVSQTREAINNYASRPVVQRVSAAPSAGASQYPSTNTPNGFVIPGYSSPKSTVIPPTNSAPTIRRSESPYRPGSTSNQQGSLHRTKKQAIQLTSANEDVHPHAEELALAVGDTMQFPRMLR